MLVTFLLHKSEIFLIFVLRCFNVNGHRAVLFRGSFLKGIGNRMDSYREHRIFQEESPKFDLRICTRVIATSSGGENPLSALQLYCPKSALFSSFTLTVLVLLVSCFSCEPSGLVNVIFGTGTPSVSHVNVIV